MILLSDLHIALLVFWTGILLAEFVIELISVDEKRALWTSKIHYWIDIYFELPIVFGVLITGFVLSLQRWPLTTLHWLKIGFALISILFNLDCCRRVIVRFRNQQDSVKLMEETRKIKLSAIGVPFGIAAAYIGLKYFT